MMEELKEILQAIKKGVVEGLVHKVEKHLNSNGTPEDSMQILRYCSNYIYQKPDGADKTKLESVISVAVLCSKYINEKTISDVSSHFRVLYHIIKLFSKSLGTSEQFYSLLVHAQSLLGLCDINQGNALAVVTALYQLSWNYSLTLSKPQLILVFQEKSMFFLAASKPSVNQLCSVAKNIVSNYVFKSKTWENTDTFYRKVLELLIGLCKEKQRLEEEEVSDIVVIMLEYAKVLNKLEKCQDFSRGMRPVVENLACRCSEAVVLSLKVGFKLVESGMALNAGKCNETLVLKLMESCKLVPKKTLSNHILVLCILDTIAMFEEEVNQIIKYNKSLKLCELMASAVSSRLSEDLGLDLTSKVAAVNNNILLMFKEELSASSNSADFLERSLPWVERSSQFTASVCSKYESLAWQIFNTGINIGNLGVIAFSNSAWHIATMFLRTCMSVLHLYVFVAPLKQKAVEAPLRKKYMLLSDALRYGALYWEAAVSVAEGHLCGIVQSQAFVSTWIKCKRDAKKNNIVLQGITCKDVLLEAESKLDQNRKRVEPNYIELLHLEIVEYNSKRSDTSKEVLQCGEAMLSIAKTVCDKVSGHLAMVQAMWTNPSLASNKTHALQSITLAKKFIEKEKLKNGSLETLLMELEAMTGFWFYLCKLQVIQERTSKEVIDTNKTESLSVQAVDPGEEMQVNDSCDVRPTLRQHVNAHAQAQTLIALNDALATWEELILKGSVLKEGEEACKCLMSTAFIYRLCGLLDPEIRSWAALITLARRENLVYYIIKGLSELMLTFPEMVPQHLVEELKEKIENSSALEDSMSSGRDQTSIQTLQLTAKAALAFYCLRTGQYALGSGYLQELREEKALEKRTVRFTEVSVLVNYIASQYAWLPSWVTTGMYRPPEPAPFLSVFACREAFALIECSESTVSEYICWRHRIVWLFFLASSWLGEVCLTIAEPRLARASLREPLLLAQKLALPLRIGEILEILARIDVLTNLWTDCEVKVDSLQRILLPHINGKENLQFEYSPSNKNFSQNGSSNLTNKENVLQEKEDRQRSLVKIECIYEDEYSLQTVDQSKGIVIGSEDRVHNLVDSDLHLSPSFKHRLENSKLRLPECSEGLLDCFSCSSPLHQDLCLALAYLTANVQAGMDRTSYALHCLKQGLKSYKSVCEKSQNLAENLSTKVGRIGLDSTPPSQLWFKFRLHKTYMLLLLFEVELLILGGHWNAAREKNLLVLQTSEILDSWMLFNCMHLFVIVAQQGYRICAAQAESQQVQTPEVSDQESLNVLTICKEGTSPPKTPVQVMQSESQEVGSMGAVKSARCSTRKPGKGSIVINKGIGGSKCAPIPKRINFTSPKESDTISSSQWNLLKQTPAVVRLRKKCPDTMVGLEVGMEKMKLKEDSDLTLEVPSTNTNTITSTAVRQVKSMGVAKGRRPKNSAHDFSQECSTDSLSSLSPSSSDISDRKDSSSDNGDVLRKAVRSSRRVAAAVTASRSVKSQAASKTIKGRRETPATTTSRTNRTLRRVLRD